MGGVALLACPARVGHEVFAAEIAPAELDLLEAGKMPVIEEHRRLLWGMVFDHAAGLPVNTVLSELFTVVKRRFLASVGLAVALAPWVRHLRMYDWQP